MPQGIDPEAMKLFIRLQSRSVIRARSPKELLEVVRGWSCLALVAARGLHGVFCTGAACLLVDVIIVVGCGLLTVLFVPFLAGLNTLLGALDGDAGWRIPTAARRCEGW
jgi:hypothetical protein